jgi:hypothetical protein
MKIKRCGCVIEPEADFGRYSRKPLLVVARPEPARFVTEILRCVAHVRDSGIPVIVHAKQDAQAIRDRVNQPAASNASFRSLRSDDVSLAVSSNLDLVLARE